MAPERSIQFLVDQLNRIISEDLTKLKYSLRKKLQPAVVLDGIELICGTGCGRERVEQTLGAGCAIGTSDFDAQMSGIKI
jgi:hypothetical protein